MGLNSLVNPEEVVRGLLPAYTNQPGGLLPLLHAVQDALGHIPDDVVPQIAQAMNRSRAEVHGVITFYHHFRRTPPGRHVVQICRAEACQACGGDALMSLAEHVLGVTAHGTDATGQVSLEPVYCLGLCAAAPALQVDQRLVARASPAQLNTILAQCLQGARAGSTMTETPGSNA